MPKNKIRYDNIYKAREMYAVLIKKERASRSYTKEEMQTDLAEKDLYSEFLKTCFEFDRSEKLEDFRRGLYLILSKIGMSKASQKTGIPRTTLYRMLWQDGNPNFKYLLQILKFLGLRLWVVTDDFIYTNKTQRFKNVPQVQVLSGGNRHVRTSK
tara:strand:+ start:278698 stop:279162 length:465 start_codon:yes stop_codon:yes gene_type:complete